MARNIDAIGTFDPARIGEVVTNELIQNTCDALVENDPMDEAAVRPAVAESWSVSDDRMRITFNLVRGATHPSGNPVTARDVAWSMRRVLTLGFGNAATLATMPGLAILFVSLSFNLLGDGLRDVLDPRHG